MPPVFVLVAGPPGSGKTTLAGPLAVRLGLPLIAKDTIKEVLMDTLRTPKTVEQSRRLGRAAVETMFAVARTAQGAVLESNFARYSISLVESLPGTVIEVRCCCPRELALARYRDRAGRRHAGHLDELRDDAELWNEEVLTPIALGPVIDVDTTGPVDVDALARQITSLAAGQPAR